MGRRLAFPAARGLSRHSRCCRCRACARRPLRDAGCVAGRDRTVGCPSEVTLATVSTGAPCLYANNRPPRSPPPDALAPSRPWQPVPAATPAASLGAPWRAPPPSPFPADEAAPPPQRARASGPLPRRGAARRRHGAPSIQRAGLWGGARAPGWPACTVRRGRRAVLVDHTRSSSQWMLCIGAQFDQAATSANGQTRLCPAATHANATRAPPTPIRAGRGDRWGPSLLATPASQAALVRELPIPPPRPLPPPPKLPPPHRMERSLDQLDRIKAAHTRPTTRSPPRLPRHRRRPWQPSPSRLLRDCVGLAPRRWWPWREATSVCREDGISWVIRKYFGPPGQSFALDDVLLEVRPVWRGPPWRGRRAHAARPGPTPRLFFQLDLSLLGVGDASVSFPPA